MVAEDEFKKEVEELFEKVVTAKPEASRPVCMRNRTRQLTVFSQNSSEIYIFGSGFRGVK